MKRAAHRRSERGVVAVVVAIVLLALMGFLALVMNSGHLMEIRSELQNATDAAALAGVREIDGTAAGLTSARTVAAQYSAFHITDKGMAVTINPENDVVFGRWDGRTRTFTAIQGTTATALAQINAIQVSAGREASRGNPVDVIWGGILGTKQSNVSAQSIAVAGGSCNDSCPAPIAFAHCAIENPLDGGSLNCGTQLVFNSSNDDNIGFTALSPDASVNTTNIRSILNGTCSPTWVGETISVANGANLTPLVTAFQTYLDNRCGSGWQSTGCNIIAPIVDVGACPNVQFNAHTGGATIWGYASFTVTGITTGQVKSITLKLDCKKVDLTGTPGCAYYGSTTDQPQLAR